MSALDRLNAIEQLKNMMDNKSKID